MVLLEKLEDPTEKLLVQKHIYRHQYYTCSKVADELLANWSECSQKFIKVIPKRYKIITEKIATYMEAGLSEELATIRVFEEAGK